MFCLLFSSSSCSQLCLHLVRIVSLESIFTKNATTSTRTEKKKKDSLHLFFFPFKKFVIFFIFFFFDLSTRCLTYARQSTIVTRNRNFVSMVLIKYPHQLLERRGEKERSKSIKGIKEVENHGKNERKGRERKREIEKERLIFSVSKWFRLHVGDILTL